MSNMSFFDAKPLPPLFYTDLPDLEESEDTVVRGVTPDEKPSKKAKISTTKRRRFSKDFLKDLLQIANLPAEINTLIQSLCHNKTKFEPKRVVLLLSNDKVKQYFTSADTLELFHWLQVFLRNIQNQ